MSCKVKIDRQMTGEKIRLMIMKKGFTFDQIADLLELNSSRVIYEWINGNKMPSLENLLSLSKYFNFKIEDVLVIEGIF